MFRFAFKPHSTKPGEQQEDRRSSDQFARFKATGEPFRWPGR